MLSRRNFLASVATVAGGLQAASLKAAEAPAQGAAAAGTGRVKVYFTKDLSAAGLLKLYKFVNGDITGRTALKLHTGEPNGPNIIPREWVKAFQAEVPSTIVECNVFYASPRQTTAGHREVLKTNGWTFSPVDIMDEDGDVALPIKGGKWLKEVHVGKHLLNYDSMIVLTHFKGHTMGGFGGCLKNISIGCASGARGKRELHREGNNDWAGGPHFMERMVEGGKAVTAGTSPISPSCAACLSTATAPARAPRNRRPTTSGFSPRPTFSQSTRRRSTWSMRSPKRNATTWSSASNRAAVCVSSPTCANFTWGRTSTT